MVNEKYDVVILGAGPAGLQAAIHAVRRKVSVLALGKLPKSSAFSAHIDNYCCLHGETGEDLLTQARQKAEESGAQFLEEDAVGIDKNDEGGFLLRLESEKTIQAKALILAMGISRKKLNLKGEKELLGKGISYCVDCDAGFYRGESVAIIGSESAALTGALTVLFYAKEVHLICEKLDASDYLADKIRESPIRIYEGKKVKEILGAESVEGLELDDGTCINASGVFIELGAIGAAALTENLDVTMDKDTMKYIDTNKKQETNVPGVYAAGDICGPPWQIAKSIGEGCIAGLEAAAFAKKSY